MRGGGARVGRNRVLSAVRMSSSPHAVRRKLARMQRERWSERTAVDRFDAVLRRLWRKADHAADLYLFGGDAWVSRAIERGKLGVACLVDPMPWLPQYSALLDTPVTR
jgi:hypothetical protein